MKSSLINISNNSEKFTYYIEISEENHPFIFQVYEMGTEKFVVDGDVMIKNNINWIPADTTDEFKTSSYNIVRLYSPVYSPLIKDNKFELIINIYFWIGNKKINISTKHCNINNLNASDKLIKTAGQEYMEMWEFAIPNTKEIIENENIKKNESNINISIIPVAVQDGELIRDSNYTIGNNIVPIITEEFLSLNIYNNINTSYDNPKFISQTIFSNKFINLSDYIRWNYGIQFANSIYELVYKDNNNIYGHLEQEFKDVIERVNWLNICEIWKSWDDFVPGASLKFSHTIKEGSDEKIIIFSKEVPITKEVFAYFVGNNSIKNIKLDNIDMNEYNIKITNKIQEETPVENSKTESVNNFQIVPVFYSSQNNGYIELHKLIDENISINLNLWTPKVKTFILKIENMEVQESGRTAIGVIFNIKHNLLPVDPKNNEYYILNEKRELVEIGKYIIK